MDVAVSVFYIFLQIYNSNNFETFSSGAGKTTLLNILTSRKMQNLDVSGTVVLNNATVDKESVRSVSSYVQQNDFFIGTLTVKEHLIFSVRDLLPHETPIFIAFVELRNETKIPFRLKCECRIEVKLSVVPKLSSYFVRSVLLNSFSKARFFIGAHALIK